MLTAIIAMQKEADALLRRADILKEYDFYGKAAFRARAFGKEFDLIVCGVGKTNAAACTALAVGSLGATSLLNFGVAGGISDRTKIGKIFRIDRAVQYDFDLSEVNGTAIGTLDEYVSPYFTLKTGNSAFENAILATGDHFKDGTDELALLNGLGAEVRDMEGGAIAHVAQFTKIPLFMYKAISDEAGKESVSQYKANLEKALGNLSDAMEIIFGEIDG